MPSRLFVIGTSWNGVQSLCQLVAQLPANFPAPICIVQHVSPEGPSQLPKILSKAGPLPASHPHQGELLQPGCIYVAPPDQHMLVKRGYVFLSRGPHENRARPAVDALFRSAALSYGPAVVGVVLTGYLDDGTAGLMAVKGGGGAAVVQDPAEAPAPSMPASALRHVRNVDHCCTLDQMTSVLVGLANDDAPPSRAAETSLLQLEDRIASGTASLEDFQDLEGRVAYCGLTCPACNSALCELPDRGMLRFRCRAGHAFSAPSVLSAQAAVRDSELSSLYGRIREESSLAHRLLADPRYHNAAQDLTQRLDGLSHKATQLLPWTREIPALYAVPPLPQEESAAPVFPGGTY